MEEGAARASASTIGGRREWASGSKLPERAVTTTGRAVAS